MRPTLQPDVDLAVVAAIALLNPLVIAVAVALGRRCDQVQKLPIAGFAAALAGMALVWLAAWLRLPHMSEAARAAGGILVAQFAVGTAWAGLAYALLRSARRP
jgi:uncharacterized membrane protein